MCDTEHAANPKLILGHLSSDSFLPRRPRRLARPRTSPFHGGNTGSNPVGDANEINPCSKSRFSPGTQRGHATFNLTCPLLSVSRSIATTFPCALRLARTTTAASHVFWRPAVRPSLKHNLSAVLGGSIPTQQTSATKGIGIGRFDA